jgi:CRISPR-associated protein Csb3
MTASPASGFSVDVDPTNPGQFFACCGLLEIAHRVWRGAEAWFENRSFVVRPLADVPDSSPDAVLKDGPEDDLASPMEVVSPVGLRLDWWVEEPGLKVWAGSMDSWRIARAMQHAVPMDGSGAGGLFNHACIVYEPADPRKKVEPFYFDSRRGSNALAIDIGFSPDSLTMKTMAYPAVEFFCLIGLQRFRPSGVRRRIYDYCTWPTPLPATMATLAVCGLLRLGGRRRFRFENAYRTEQRKHKAFTPAVPV